MLEYLLFDLHMKNTFETVAVVSVIVNKLIHFVLQVGYGSILCRRSSKTHNALAIFEFSSESNKIFTHHS